MAVDGTHQATDEVIEAAHQTRRLAELESFLDRVRAGEFELLSRGGIQQTASIDGKWQGIFSIVLGPGKN